MADERPATRLTVFLTEDDREGARPLAEVLLARAEAAGLAGATLWQGIEGFGRHGHLRAARLADLARGLPLVVEIVDDEPAVAAFVAQVRALAPGALVTLEAVQTSRGPERAG